MKLCPNVLSQICYPTDSDEKKELPLQEMLVSSFKGSTALLVELEDKVAQAAASVQSAETEVSRTAAFSETRQFFFSLESKSGFSSIPRFLPSRTGLLP